MGEMEQSSTSAFKYVFSNKKVNLVQSDIFHASDSKSNLKRESEHYVASSNKKAKVVRDPPFTMESVPDHYFHLGGLKFAVVSNFANVVRIHLRQFKEDEKGFILPTKKGVTLTPFIWKSIDLDNVKLSTRTRENVIIRNSLLVSTELIGDEPHVSFQCYFQREDLSRCFHPSSMILNEREWNSLVDLEEEITRSVIKVMFGRVLHRLIFEQATKRAPVDNCANLKDAEAALFTAMTRLLKNYLQTAIDDVLECDGCIMNTGNQLEHECVTATHELKLNRYGDLALCKINLKTFASEFVQGNVPLVNFITMPFLEKLNFNNNLLQSVKDLYVASDLDPNRLC